MVLTMGGLGLAIPGLVEAMEEVMEEEAMEEEEEEDTVDMESREIFLS